jgi:hypothetical protein
MYAAKKKRQEENNCSRFKINAENKSGFVALRPINPSSGKSAPIQRVFAEELKPMGYQEMKEELEKRYSKVPPAWKIGQLAADKREFKTLDEVAIALNLQPNGQLAAAHPPIRPTASKVPFKPPVAPKPKPAQNIQPESSTTNLSPSVAFSSPSPPPAAAAPIHEERPVVGEQKAGLRLYRGEKSEWWPEPKKRLISGMTIREPWNYKSMEELFAKLQADIRKEGGGDVPNYAQYLRAQGRPNLLATAHAGEGAFTTDYNYTLEIKNARTFKWGPNLTLGEEVDFTVPNAIIDADYIVLNADTITKSTVLGFGHKTGTKEVTFFHDLPIDFVVNMNKIPREELGILKIEELSPEDSIALNNLLRKKRNKLSGKMFTKFS